MKKSTISITTIIALALLLVSCSMLPGSRPASESAMQTEIAQILTAMVTETEVPLIELPPTEEVIASTEVFIEPIADQILDLTPTVEIGQLITSTPEDLVFEFYSCCLCRKRVIRHRHLRQFQPVTTLAQHRQLRALQLKLLMIQYYPWELQPGKIPSIMETIGPWE